ncbi:MAG: hypothetical protein A2785_03725 [Candidatus Chisholmbacteria bacterium RIFCSPHIGHO2_01_FULL_49_18]|uniref:Transglycosylase SLT domain-containing protein n=2 Tax=Candidatus Chisholmiibacteriota TaxID=1817900 RepID=A0A1G1VNP0_9BACT|nr:MAG: hypothetical protein A2785_03725 [Candidatus Chisholmbacteria bacterium RIFCSPHIGHO2_01_FULL_49_18]OGY19459.1 MAG: hypothetical protein A3A65_06135 [Candidatus Chisholmbacteria bacterium RIFCSPLOWO2_01_FULL_49_14]
MRTLLAVSKASILVGAGILVAGLYTLVISSPPIQAQGPVPPIETCPIVDCSALSDEPHPLRPYPCRICGPESQRTIDETDAPYCAMRPWAVETFEYLKNEQACPEDDPNFPCVKARQLQIGCSPNPWNLPCIAGTYGIDLRAYELPLVSVNRSGFDFLTYFNRNQEHLADYLEGRSYYEGIVESNPDDTLGWISTWNRLGIFRKLASTLPRRQGQMIQDSKKISMIRGAGAVPQSNHDYIVGYVQGGNPAPWGSGTPMRLSNFNGHYPPEYACDAIADPFAQQVCIQNWVSNFDAWKETVYGKLWPYVPMFTREDAIGYVNVFPEPGQPFLTQSAQVSIPHLPRLKEVSDILKDMLTSRLLANSETPETPPYEGIACPAGPWYLQGAACTGTDACTPGACSDPGSLPSLSGGSGACAISCDSLAGNDIPPLMKDIIETAAQEYDVPGALIVAIMYAEGGFERQSCYGDNWTDALVEESSACGGQVPNCCSCNVSPSGARGPFQWIPSWFGAFSDAVKVVDSSREGDPCNFMDAVFAAAKKLSLEHGGAASYSPPSCDGITYNTLAPRNTSCGGWDNQDIATAVRQYVGSCVVGYQRNVFYTYDQCR